MDAAEWDDRYRAAELIWTAEPNQFLVEQDVGGLESTMHHARPMRGRQRHGKLIKHGHARGKP